MPHIYGLEGNKYKRNMQYFWTNTIWFILLGITTLIGLLYVLVKGIERKRLFALFLTFSGIAYMIEIQILLVFKGYAYFPMILSNVSRLDDSVIGNLFSQFSIAGTALLISFLKLKPRWYLICAALYGGIEELFLYLGIYKHYWYQTWMTVIGFSILLWFLDKIYKKTFNTPGSIFRYMLIFLAVYVLHVHFVNWPFRLLGYPQFNTNIFQDENISIVFNNIVNFIVLFNIIMFAYYKRLKWYYHIAIIAALYAVYYIASLLDYIVYKDIGLLLIFAAAQIFGMYINIFIADRLYGYKKKTYSSILSDGTK